MAFNFISISSPLSYDSVRPKQKLKRIDAQGRVAETFEISVTRVVVHLRDWSRGPWFKLVLFWTDVKVEYEFSSAVVPKFETFIGTV